MVSEARRSRIEQLCDEALIRIDAGIEKHKRGEPEDLSIPMLETIRREVVQMRAALDPAVFDPGYARFMLDWPATHGLVDFLTEVSYQYQRIRK